MRYVCRICYDIQATPDQRASYEQQYAYALRRLQYDTGLSLKTFSEYIRTASARKIPDVTQQAIALVWLEVSE